MLQVGINSYVTLLEADEYFMTRIDSDAWSTAVPEDKNKAIVTATNMVDEEFTFIGSAVSADQLLAWPRKAITYFDSKLGNLVVIEEGSYPNQLKRAVFELTLHLLVNEDLLSVSEQTFERIKVGPIEIEDSASDYKKPPRIPPVVGNSLRQISRNTQGTMVWRSN